MHVFLDSNVLSSASLRERNRQFALFALAEAGRCYLVTLDYAFNEAKRNLMRKAPRASRAVSALMEIVTLSPDAPDDLNAWARLQGLPSKDAPILAAAVAARADLLVTGDRRHFGPLFGRSFRGVRVLSLADGLAAVLESLKPRS